MKNILILVSLLLISWQPQAQTQAPTTKDLVTKCRTLTDSLKRLVCYDDIVVKSENQANVAQNIKKPEPAKEILPKAISEEGASKSAAVSKAIQSEKQIEVKSKSVEQFGIEHKIAQENAEDRIYALASSVTKDPFGKLSVKLDNGQRWKQIDSGKIRLKVGESVYIERGALNSFFMSKDDINRRVRVKRIN